MNLPGPKRGRDAEPRLPIVLVLLPAFFLLGSLFAVPLRERAPRGLRLAGTRVDAPPAPGAGTPLLSPSGRGAPSDPTTARRSAPGALAIARSLAAPPEPAPPDDPSDPRGWVLIHLLEAGTGAPAAGAEVELTLFPRDLGFDEPPSTLLRRADEDGTVRVPLEEGEVRVVAWQGPLVGGPLGTSISARTESLVELELVRGFEVSGLVRDAATGLPVAGAEVRFWTFSESDAVATADDGTFRHPRFPASEFAEQVQVRAPGYGATVRYLQVLADGSYRIPDPLVEGGAIRGTGTPWIEVSLVPEQRIRGTVVDAGGRPVAGATVHAEGYYHTLPDIASLDAATATTDTTGAFELAGLRSDISHGVAVRAAGFAEAYREVAPGEQETRLQPLVLDREVTIAGVVVDAEGYPVQDIRVLLRRTAQDATEADSLDRMEGLLDVSFRTWDDEFEVRTRPDGTFLFGGVIPAQYSLAVARDAEDLVTSELDASSVSPDAFVELHLPDSTLTLRGSIVGLELDSTRVLVSRAGPSGEPDPIAWVLPDSSGRFRVSGLDPYAPYELSARGPSSLTGEPLELEGTGFAFETVVLTDPALASVRSSELADSSTR